MPPEDRPHESDESHENDEQTVRNVLTSRRRFLEATGAAGLVGGVGGFAMAQEDGPTTYEFGGEIAAWQGRSPSAIEGESNPTLQLEAGAEYEVIWENLDGQPHDFVIQDSEGNDLVGTEIMSEQGATRSFTFTASEEMAQYVCTVHPTSMVGDIEFGTGGGTEQPQEMQRFVPAGPTVGAQKVADGPLVNPVNLRSVPGMQDTHVIVDQPGQVYLHQDGELQEDPVFDISDRVMILADTQGGFERSEGFDERGLLGLAFHPNFQENGQFYVRYSSAQPRTDSDSLVGPGDRNLPDDWDHVAVLAEFQMADGDGVQMDPDSERVLLEVPEPQFNHNGGEVTFGPDDYLYTTLGDGGGANDTALGHSEDWYDQNDGGNGQDVTENLLGSVLRIDVDQEGENTPYAVPDDNPLVDVENAYDEIYAWGLRNPWRASFNNEQLVTADVGQALFEEVDVIENGGNYGWNVREGFHCFNADDATAPPDQCPTNAPDQAPFSGQELLDPVLEYPHSYQGSPVGISITGGYVYEGDQLSELSGQYVFADWSTNFAVPEGRVFVATPNWQDGAATMTDDGATGNQTGNATGTEIGNVSVGQEAEGAPNETTGNESGRTATEAPTQEDIDLMQPSEQPWPFQEVLFEDGENQQLNRFIQAFGRDAQGNVYVLASRTGRLTSEAGEVYRLVPAGEGEQITPPPTPTPEMDAAENETSGNETTGNESDN